MCWKKKEENKKIVKSDITYVNIPISSKNEDKIGIVQYANELKSAIKKGAQSIAVTSDFGGGKSSLIRYLETQYNGLFTKFCYINLWGQFTKNDLYGLHKSFIYQLASSISTRRGNYVSKRLSKNYGMFTIALPTIGASVMSFVIFLLWVLGLVCTTWYEDVEKYIPLEFFVEHHAKIGVLAFAVAVCLALFFLYKSDIVFSAKKATEEREVDEHELMDIYRSYICKRHFKHYIVVIEDLDRSNSKNVIKFIKELRRYYIPCERKQSKWRVINWFHNILGNINRITFIVNIKSESQIVGTQGGKLYAKAFDYVLNLKEINIDNYDVILKKLLKDNQKLFEEHQIPVFDEQGGMKSQFEWIIRGEKLDIREIKTRLNSAILTYVNLCSKFNKENIKIEKCIASSYITNAHKDEYIKVKDIGFDGIIDLYVKDPDMKEQDIIDNFKNANSKGITISEAFARDIKTMICNDMLDSDYRQYFYNFPTDSYLYNDKQMRLTNIILYDKDVSQDNQFDELVKDVSEIGEEVITNAFDRLDRLGVYYPKCMFYSKQLFDLVIQHSEDKLWVTIENNLSYDADSISVTAHLLMPTIKRSLMVKQEYVDKICDIFIRKAQGQAFISLRRNIIEHFEQNILCFKSLFWGNCPLITKAEAESLKENIRLLQLINFSSLELEMDLVDTIHSYILDYMDLFSQETLDSVAVYYNNLYAALGKILNTELTQYMFGVMLKAEKIHPKLEAIILTNNDNENILKRYKKLINVVAANDMLSDTTMNNIEAMEITGDLSEEVCKQLRDNRRYKVFVKNACTTNIDLINFQDEMIIDAINGISFPSQEDDAGLFEILRLLRQNVLSLSVGLAIEHYRRLFELPYPNITEDELNIIQNKNYALQLIDLEQIDKDAAAYIAEYLCRAMCSVGDSYEILKFVCSVKDVDVKKYFFMCLDFDAIQYYRISEEKKKDVVEKLSDTFDFDDIAEQLLYMTHTRCSYEPFEKQIWKAIKDKKFAEHKMSYVEFVRCAKKVTNDMIKNLCEIGTIYSMPKNVTEKLFTMKKYRYYVVSQNLRDKSFNFEVEKIDVLDSVYSEVFLDKNGLYKNSQKYMAENFDFVTYMCDRKRYENESKDTRMLFVNCYQTVDCLRDLVENNTVKFCIEYLSKISGFRNEEAARFFIEIIKVNPEIAASEEVYANNYEKLVDSDLKGIFTRYHNRAKKAS